MPDQRTISEAELEDIKNQVRRETLEVVLRSIWEMNRRSRGEAPAVSAYGNMRVAVEGMMRSWGTPAESIPKMPEPLVRTLQQVLIKSRDWWRRVRDIIERYPVTPDYPDAQTQQALRTFKATLPWGDLMNMHDDAIRAIDDAAAAEAREAQQKRGW